jgi:hypothetical protein
MYGPGKASLPETPYKIFQPTGRRCMGQELSNVSAIATVADQNRRRTTVMCVAAGGAGSITGSKSKCLGFLTMPSLSILSSHICHALGRPPHALQAHSGPARRMFLDLGLDDFLGLGAVAGSPVDVGC